MYIATLYNEEHGDIESVTPAETFDDAVAHVFDAIDQSSKHVVEAGKEGKFFRLEVSKGNVTLATVSDVPPASAKSMHERAFEIIEACNALDDGNCNLIKALFTTKKA